MLEKKLIDHEMLVTFTLPPAIEAKRVFLVGEFNSWKNDATPMIRNGERLWRVTILLPINMEFEFRYLVNNIDWHNDWNADGYKSNPYGADNSVVSTRVE
jgi:1,4-alpha-glucan branching enzyme